MGKRSKKFSTSTKIRAEKEKSMSLITSLPEDLILDILARVSRCDYPIVSLVSKHFHSLVTSPELYERRSLLGCIEVYVVLYNLDTREYSLCCLGRKGNNNRLFFIHPLPRLLSNASYMAVGSKIYVLDKSLFSIDCRSHTTVQLISNNKSMGCYKVAGVIRRKIYMIFDDSNSAINKPLRKVMVFDTETQMWEPEITYQDMLFGKFLCGCVVMADKIYISDTKNSYVYMPKESKWETDEVLNSKEWKNACVIDDVLYYYDRYEYKFRWYDPNHKCWGVMKGVERFIEPQNLSH